MPAKPPRRAAPAKPAARTAQITPKVLEAMNEQLAKELASWYEYLSMSAWLESNGLPGAAKWMRAQAQEELAHALRFMDFIQDRNGKVDLRPLVRPTHEFASAAEVFERAFANEQDVTAAIVRVHELADAERDYVSQPFLHSFLAEQIEEEKSALRNVETFRMAGTDGPALLILDRELGGRGASG